MRSVPQEFSWLQLMSKFKYERLSGLLAERASLNVSRTGFSNSRKMTESAIPSYVQAYLFWGAELQHMVELVYPTLVERTLIAHSQRSAVSLRI